MFCKLELDLYLYNHRHSSVVSVLRNYSGMTIKVTLKYSCYNLYILSALPMTCTSPGTLWFSEGCFFSKMNTFWIFIWIISREIFVPVNLHKYPAPCTLPWIYQQLFIYSLHLHVWFIKEQTYTVGHFKYYTNFCSGNMRNLLIFEDIFH